MAAPGSAGSDPDPTAELWSKVGDPLLPWCIYVAAKLELSTGGAPEGMTVDELASSRSLNGRILRGVVHTLTAAGFFEERETGRFVATPLGLLLAEPEVRDRVLDRFEVEIPYFRRLEGALRSPLPAFDLEYGRGFYEFLATNPRYASGFRHVLARGAREAAAGLGDALDLGRCRSLLDVGGGNGALLASLLAKQPLLRGAVLDTPVEPDDEVDELARPGVEDRAQRIVGDFFQRIPGGYDLYLLRWILCDWDDGSAQRILENCRESMDGKARLVVAEPLWTSDNRSPYLRQLDFVLRLTTRGGLRTASEFRDLFARAGLSWSGEPRHVAYYDILEATPA